MGLVSEIKTALSALSLSSFQETSSLLFTETQRLDDQHRFGRTRTCEVIIQSTKTASWWTVSNPHYTVVVDLRIFYPVNAENTNVQDVIQADAKLITQCIFEKTRDCPKTINAYIGSLINSSIQQIRNQGLNSSQSGFQSWTDIYCHTMSFRFDVNS